MIMMDKRLYVVAMFFTILVGVGFFSGGVYFVKRVEKNAVTK